MVTLWMFDKTHIQHPFVLTLQKIRIINLIYSFDKWFQFWPSEGAHCNCDILISIKIRDYKLKIKEYNSYLKE